MGRWATVSQDEDLLREGAFRLKEHEDFSGIIYAHQLRITVSQMVDDLELIATATSQEERQVPDSRQRTP